MRAALLAALLSTGWRCDITDPSLLPTPPADVVTVPGLMTWAARVAGCDRKWRRYG